MIGKVKRHGGLVALGLVVCAVFSGCKTSTIKGVDRGPAPSYAEAAKLCNERADRLGRVWSRASISFRWTEDEKSRYEQGDGFFQLVQPSKLALDVGKAGEVAMWMGCDEQRYWLIQRGDEKIGYVGRHDGPGSVKLAQLGLPGTALDLINLAGVTKLPDKPPKGTKVSWTDEGRWRVFLPTEYGAIARELDPENGEPAKVEIFDGEETEEPCIISVLANYAPVELSNEGGLWPRIATRMSITDAANGNKMTISLEGMNDGIRGTRPGTKRLAPEVFDFDKLCPRLGVKKVVDLDEER